ncbi:MAG: homocysteine S-methyltransferase family protein, partial [Clostridiales bacterium]|nr:homocysteine S-methyltransferase family protein [Clostridiales bacterium]
MTTSFKNTLSERVLLYDGSKGFLLMQRGLAGGECPDLWNITRKDDVLAIHRAYVEAGSDVIQTNTLQGSRHHLEAWGLYERLGEINREGVRLAKAAAGQKALVAASVGPTGRLMAPFGDMPFEEAAECFSEQIRAVLEAGADILHFETFTDLSELRAAVIAAKRLSPGAPIIATLSFEKNGKTVMGDSAGSAMAVLASLGVDCAGANCGLAPGEMLSMFGGLAGFGVPLCSKPNAGAPVMENGEPRYGATVDEYYGAAFGFAELGARLIGGCCGSGPAHIAKLREAVDAINAGNAGAGRGAPKARGAAAVAAGGGRERAALAAGADGGQAAGGCAGAGDGTGEAGAADSGAGGDVDGRRAGAGVAVSVAAGAGGGAGLPRLASVAQVVAVGAKLLESLARARDAMRAKYGIGGGAGAKDADAMGAAGLADDAGADGAMGAAEAALADLSDLAAAGVGAGAGDAEAEIIDRLLEAEEADEGVAVIALLIAGRASGHGGAAEAGGGSGDIADSGAAAEA